ncbi:hypothetical protein FB45DRAFT_911852 [Roridomyces roridus]|uniref:Cytochrome b561 domain-containing protein n=1 Tax=Roridomyces roridus TaxID=1738132 RepID=A0AAD7FPL3_9AGAR|nr:hypothetical protein FB45DRAFT_911852 [Roridomyces roridus]
MSRRQITRSKSPAAMNADPDAEDYELLLPSEQQTGKPRDQEEQLISEGRSGDSVAYYLALTGAGVFTAVTWVVVLLNNPLNVGWFAFHPTLQSLSLLLLTYGILTLQPTSQPKTKAAGLARHQYAILGAGFPIIFLGTLAIVLNKYVHGAVHFKSWHGKIGIASMVWIFGQVILGGGSVWFGGAAFGGGSKAKALWKYHRLSGYLLFLSLMVTCNLGGFWSNWGNNNCPSVIRIIAYIVSLAAMTIGLYIRVRPSKMKFY